MNFKKFSELIMIEQTLFALPFAYLGILFAGGASWQVWLWATVALFGARTAGMAFNRLLDAHIDGKNPRTADRLVPAGRVSRASVWVVALSSSGLLVFAAFMLNTLVFYLSFVAIFLLFTYSLFKRFSASSHFYLGLVEAAAPIGGFLAVTGAWEWVALLPGAAILFWIAGLDMLYAIQDMEFDREEGLHSIPARFGLQGARRLSLVSYFFAIVSLVAAGFFAGMGFIYYFFVLAVAGIMSKQQIIVAFAQSNGIQDVPAQSNFLDAMKRVFGLNRFIAPLLFIGALVDLLVGKML